MNPLVITLVPSGPPAFLQRRRAGKWESVSRFPGGTLDKAKRWFEAAVARQYPSDTVLEGVTVAGEFPELRMITPFAASPVPRDVIQKAFELHLAHLEAKRRKRK